MTYFVQPNSSSQDLAGAINYILANLNTNFNPNFGTGIVNSTNTTATATNGQTTAYLYRYLDIAYADNGSGSSNFSSTPLSTNSFYGLRNTNTNVYSTNPADYVWYQINNTFSGGKALWYQTFGGLQINLVVATSAPATAYQQVPNGTPIDLTVVSTATNLQGRSGYAISTVTLGNTPATYTTTGNATFPPDNTWGGSEHWVANPPSYTASENVYQIDGIYNPSTNLTLWASPYLATLKVGSLSAINANLGTITAGTLNAVTVNSSVINSSTLNSNTINAATINSASSFAGSLTAATGTFTGSLSAATGSFSGTVSASTINSSTINSSTINAATINSASTFAGTISAGTINSSTINSSTINAGTTPPVIDSVNHTISSGAGGLINPNGTFAFGTTSSNIIDDGTGVYLNGLVLGGTNATSLLNLPTVGAYYNLFNFTVTKVASTVLGASGSIYFRTNNATTSAYAITATWGLYLYNGSTYTLLQEFYHVGATYQYYLTSPGLFYSQLGSPFSYQNIFNQNTTQLAIGNYSLVASTINLSNYSSIGTSLGQSIDATIVNANSYQYQIG